MWVYIETRVLTDKSKVFDVVIRGDTGEELSLLCHNEQAARAVQAGLAGLIEVHTTEVVEESW